MENSHRNFKTVQQQQQQQQNNKEWTQLFRQQRTTTTKKMTPKKRELQCYAESSWVTSGTPDSTCPGSFYQLYFGCILEFIVFNISLHLSFSAFE